MHNSTLIPEWVIDLESYRRWARSTDFPTTGTYSFLDGVIWVDLHKEEFFTHNQVKGNLISTLGRLIQNCQIGYLFTSRAIRSQPGANMSTMSDLFFVSYETVISDRARFVEEKNYGPVEVEGSPNMVLEIVSDSSVKKDTQVLKEKYAKAGVDEYWLVDARGSDLRFEIWRLQDESYVASPNDEGWLTSTVFGRAFKLEQGKDRLGHPRFQLHVRE